MTGESKIIKTIEVELEPGEFENFECPFLEDISICAADRKIECPDSRADYFWNIAPRDCPLRRGSIIVSANKFSREGNQMNERVIKFDYCGVPLVIEADLMDPDYWRCRVKLPDGGVITNLVVGGATKEYDPDDIIKSEMRDVITQALARHPTTLLPWPPKDGEDERECLFVGGPRDGEMILVNDDKKAIETKTQKYYEDGYAGVVVSNYSRVGQGFYFQEVKE